MLFIEDYTHKKIGRIKCGFQFQKFLYLRQQKHGMMATSIRDLKKELKYAFGSLIDQVLLIQLASDKDNKSTGALINEILDVYEEFLGKVNAHRKAEDKKAYFKQLNAEIRAKLSEFQDKINQL